MADKVSVSVITGNPVGQSSLILKKCQFYLSLNPKYDEDLGL